MSSLPNIQRAAAFRSVQFVTRNREQVHCEAALHQSEFLRGLYGIGMKRDACLSSNLADFFDGFHDVPEFIIRQHYGDKHRLGTNRSPHVLGFTMPSLLTGKIVTSTPRRVRALQGSEPRCVLHGRRDHMFLAPTGSCAFSIGNDAKDGVIVRLRAAAGKHDFRGTRSQRLYGHARLLDGSAHAAAKPMIELALPYFTRNTAA